jgi:hypothetical protein
MNTRSTFLLMISLLVLPSQPAHARWERSESIEWWTNVSDTVTVMQIVDAKAIEPLNGHWLSQRVTCQKPIPLKGNEADEISFRQDYWKDTTASQVDQPLRTGDHVLIFRAHEDGKTEAKVAFWLNLSKPDERLSGHAAYDNDCKLLTSEKDITTLLKSRIVAERPPATRRRGLIVNFAGEKGDMSWDFVRTADPEYRKVLVEQLRQSKFSDEKASAIFNLASYPSGETVKLIRPYLNDPETAEVQKYGPDQDTIRYYPIRQAAYLALKVLGEKVEEPTPYFKNVQPWDFEVGFEDPAYFPYGDWKRFEHLAD